MGDFVVTALALRGEDKPLIWARGQSLPNVENVKSRIEKLIIVGDAVDAFVRVDGSSGIHFRHVSPAALFTVEVADRETWDADVASLDEDDEDAPSTRDFSQLIDMYRTVWAVNQPIAAWGATVTRVVVDEYGTARVYALPDVGTNAASTGVGLRITFFPQTGFLLMSDGIPIAEWLELQNDVEAEALGDDEEEEEVEEEVQAVETPQVSTPDVAEPTVNGAHAEVPLPPPPAPAVPGLSS